AEGVETPDQARFLNSIDCSVVQGYLYDKPLCEEEFFERLKARRYSGKIEI
ncbi:MAG: EAL domain-containing protein, partial [Ruminiclostridium sp.]|nr:EAL domain-containing protein [Ruminiclostridium sp.]